METVDLNHAFWRGRPTFVTGGTGLLGSWLVKRLHAAGADVVCLVREQKPDREYSHNSGNDNVKAVYGDIRDQTTIERALQEFNIDTVMHVAAQAIVSIAKQDPVPTFESNIGGTWSVLEACRRSPSVKQIIVASSDKAYGDQEQLPYTEGSPLQARHPYEVSKAAADMIASTYATTYKLPIAITRCGNFYGGGDLNWNRIIPGTIRSILQGEAPVIRSDGEYIRDYFYVEDGAAAYMLLAEQLAARPELIGEAFNFSNEIKLTVRQIVQLILTKMGSDLQPEILNEPSNEIRRQYLSSEKALQMLQWKPLFTLDEGLEKTIKWYKDFFNERKS